MAEIMMGFAQNNGTAGINYLPDVTLFNEPSRLALVDRAGASTGVEFSLTNARRPNGNDSDYTSGYSFPDFPDEVVAPYFYTDTDVGYEHEYTFWNMPAGTHELQLLSRRMAGGSGRVSHFGFGTDSGTVAADSNNTVILSLFYTATAGEDVIFTWYAAQFDFAYLNAARLLLAEPSVNTPINPSVTNLLATSARLNWEQG